MNTQMIQLYPVGDVRFLLSSGPDLISRCLRGGEYWDASLVQISKLFLAQMKQPVFVDIGANLGAITIPVGKYLQECGGRVYSIEAQRNVYYQLCGNIFANNLAGHCFAYHTALSNQIGTVEIPFLDSHVERNLGSLSIDATIRSQQNTLSSHIDRYETVDLTTLDAMRLPAASLVKIDVEGLELEVLEGAVNWLKQSRFPPLLLEVWGDYMQHQIAKKQRLFAFLRERLGYGIFLAGELCIAQHHQNPYFKFSLDGHEIHVESDKRHELS